MNTNSQTRAVAPLPRVTRLRDPSLAGEWTCASADAASHGAILYVDASPDLARQASTALARQIRLPVLALDHGEALDAVMDAYRALVARGIAPVSIVFAGASAARVLHAACRPLR